MFTEEASFSDNLAGHDETTTMSESKIREAISLKEVPSFLWCHISHPHYFQLVLGPSYQSPELLPPQQLSGERIAPGKNRFVGSWWIIGLPLSCLNRWYWLSLLEDGGLKVAKMTVQHLWLWWWHPSWNFSGPLSFLVSQGNLDFLSLINWENSFTYSSICICI